MLTQRIIDRIHNKKRTSVELTDSGCLSIVIYLSGAKKCCYRYTYEGHRKSVVLGEYPAVSLKAARSLAFSYVHCDNAQK